MLAECRDHQPLDERAQGRLRHRLRDRLETRQQTEVGQGGMRAVQQPQLRPLVRGNVAVRVTPAPRPVVGGQRPSPIHDPLHEPLALDRPGVLQVERLVDRGAAPRRWQG